MKLDKLLEQMMMMQQQQISNGNNSTNEHEQAQQQQHRQGQQSANGNGNFQLSRTPPPSMAAFFEELKSKKLDEVLMRTHQQNNGDGGGMAPQHSHLPQQHMAWLSAFLKANLPLSSLPQPSSSASSSPPNPILQSPTINNNINSSSSSSSSSSSHQIVPLSKDIASQGLMAVGGCRQCSKTFTDRLALIHHFVDHFPNIFYSFEEQQQPQQPSNGHLSPKLAKNDGPKDNNNGLENNGGMDFLGQLAGFFAMAGANPSLIGGVPNGPFPAEFHSPANPAMFGHMFRPYGTMTEMVAQQPQSNLTAPQPAKRSQPSVANPKMANGRKRQSQQDKSNSSKKGAEDGSEAPTAAGSKHARTTGGTARNGPTVAKTTTSSSSPVPTLSELPYHMCPHCCLTFAETSAYRAHLAMHENESAVTAVPASMAPFLGLSPSPGTTAPDSSNQQLQQVLQQQPQQMLMRCTLCDMRFGNAFRLAEHMRLHSTHTCAQCQKTFMTAFDLNIHMSTHTGYTYDCKDCGKHFPTRKTLAEHNRTHRMLLSSGGGASASPEPPKKAKVGSGGERTGSSSQEREQSPMGNGAAATDAIEKRRLRAARPGEKSRRSATLVAIESDVTVVGPPASCWPASVAHSPPNALLSSVAGDHHLFAASDARSATSSASSSGSSLATAHVLEGNGMLIGQLLQQITAGQEEKSEQGQNGQEMNNAVGESVANEEYARDEETRAESVADGEK